MIFPHAVENRKIRGICPCPAIREGGHARRGTSRQRAHKPRLRAPHRRIPPLLTLPQHIYYSTFRPKRKGFSFIIIVFCGVWGKNVVFGQSGCVRFCRETVQAAWVCAAKVSKGRSQSPLVAPAGAKSMRLFERIRRRVLCPFIRRAEEHRFQRIVFLHQHPNRGIQPAEQAE